MLILAGCGKGAPDDPLVARLGDASISQRQLRERYGLPEFPQGKADTTGTAAAWEEAARDWALREILLREAQKRRLDQDTVFLSRMENLRAEILVNLLYERSVSSIPVDSSEIVEEYNSHRQEYISTSDQVDLVYLQAPTRELANQARKALQEGSELADVLGINESLSGEAVGWVSSQDLNAEIAKAVFNLVPGGISYPLKRDAGGYIVLQCRQRRWQGTLLPIEEVYDEIRMKVLQRKRMEAEKELRDSLWSVYKPEILVTTVH